LEELRIRRVREALERKSPKLADQKAQGRVAVLAPESNDIGLGNAHDIGEAFRQAASGRDDLPDIVFLVKTEVGTWYVWPLKEAPTFIPVSAS